MSKNALVDVKSHQEFKKSFHSISYVDMIVVHVHIIQLRDKHKLLQHFVHFWKWG